MQPGIWRRIKEEISIWRVGTLPGIVVLCLVIILRLTSAMQSLEWLVFDSFLRLRPVEPIDERIVIVGINEDDIHNFGYPIPDQEMASLLKKLQAYAPRAIGVDIVRDIPVEPGSAELVSTFQQHKNLLGIEKALPVTINPPPYLSDAQIGFVDQIPDADGKLRRSLLGTITPKGYKFALSLKLAEMYLANEGIQLKYGFGDRNPIWVGNIQLPRVYSNSGGYVRTDAGGFQVLLNFRSGQERFRTVTLGDIKAGKFQPEWIRDRIVIIGMTAPSAKDLTTTSAIPSSKFAPPGQVYGVEIHAHAVSQLISAVLNSRPLLKTWQDEWEYLWIITWGFLGIAHARLTKLPLLNLVTIGFASFILVLVAYIFLILGWWIPLAPAIIIYTLNSLGLTALYQYEQALKAEINAHYTMIERTFETIHNGPLQTLAKVLKLLKEQNLPTDKLLPEIEKELEKLNYDLRGIYEFLQREPVNQDKSLYLGQGLVINLHDPIHQILYQVYSYTLERDFPCFKTIKIKIRTFEPIEEKGLSIEQKRGLCRFLEEALCNVGKHAAGVTRLEVNCSSSEGWHTLSIIDDALAISSYKEGRGTQQFRNLARQLKGKFRRVSLSPRGTLCELSWPANKFWFY
ncbi:putative sensor with CHASE2 domain protein [Tolypothrix tenuis PCC 7101]|uniref:Putative sensor with CHASE2 domain protein n=1 Tax=Tolypothrix tenuis PCC 7101 TaxID=231146 RepID=A0A1Z4MS50_9CYAN|nr:CHASE2 domain-containing protein [Aulosira sp. FACHB-113]BAY96310.1 putative sensor with CHASE2 domain protein [Tolypothrix tenuis PCC 7101]BAZ73183.1 putative sensor with CHASE2 domain protein [Aulosira laxa NIES-50]